MKEVPFLFEALSQVLQEARIDAGVSQRELARRMECARSFVASVEGCRNQLSINAFMVMADALDILPEELIKRLRAKLLMFNSRVQTQPALPSQITN